MEKSLKVSVSPPISPLLFGKLVATKRRLLGYTQKDLSTKVNLKKGMIGAMERGQKMPNAMATLMIMAILDITYQDLVTVSQITLNQ